MINIDLRGKTALVTGVQNEHSLAWAIAKKLSSAGARLAFSYQGERNRPALEKLTADLAAPLLVQCDVTNDSEVDDLFAQIEKDFGRLDQLVHSIGFAPPAAMQNPFVETTRTDWQIALDISAYSLVALANRAKKMMNGGSIVALTYYAAEKVFPKYNIMGVAKAALEASVRYLAYDLGAQNIRVNAVSPGPMRTVAARSIPGFSSMYEKAAKAAPLSRNASHEEVGNMCLFLLSELSSGTTGETIYVDAGYHVMGMAMD